MKDWQSNNPAIKHLLMLKQRSQRRRMLRGWLQIAFVLMLLGLTLVLSGCATRSPAPSLPPTVISMPVPPKSPPSVSYSAQWSMLVDEWQKKLESGLTKP